MNKEETFCHFVTVVTTKKAMYDAYLITCIHRTDLNMNFSRINTTTWEKMAIN